MEKKLKYLLGCFILGFGLLINHSFGVYTDIYVEGVTLPITDTNFQSSANYLYKFLFRDGRIGDPGARYIYLGYERTYDGITDSTYTFCGEHGNTCASYIKSFNNSSYSLSLYSGWVSGSEGYNMLANVNQLQNMPRLSFGLGSDYGKMFVYVNSPENDSGVLSPHFGMGKGFFAGYDYRTVTVNSDSSRNFFRVFYEQNVNLSSPLNSFDLVTLDGNTGYVARMNFTNQNTIYQTQYQPGSASYLIDYGSQGLKGLHFGGYGVGYSYAVDFSQDNSTLYWGNWSFSSLGSRCGLSAMQLGFSAFNAYTSNNCLSLGLLVLKGDTYVSRGNNGSVIILGKNPNNTKQILYEQFDCADDDILRIMDPNSEFCSSLGHGYITINGNSDVLPFSSAQDPYTLGSGNAFLDFMFTKGVYGYMSIDLDNNQYCMHSSDSQLCFKLHATPNLRSLKEFYLASSGDIAGNGGTVGGIGLDDIVINQPISYYTYTGLLEYTMSGQFTVAEDSGYFDNYVDYVWVNGVPQLNKLKFGVCPFVTNSNFATLGFEDFSFDFLVPFKCILAGVQAGYTSVNVSGFVNLNLPHKFIDSNLNNDNVEIVGHFVALLLILGMTTLLFYFLKMFK